MTPEQHAAQAKLWLENSHRHTDQGNEGDERIAEHSARQAIAHALLALRPAPAPSVIRLPDPAAFDEKEVPIPKVCRGVWVTRYYDGSSWAVHASELDARRAADDGQRGCGDVVAFLPFGMPIGELDRPGATS